MSRFVTAISAVKDCLRRIEEPETWEPALTEQEKKDAMFLFKTVLFRMEGNKVIQGFSERALEAMLKD